MIPDILNFWNVRFSKTKSRFFCQESWHFFFVTIPDILCVRYEWSLLWRKPARKIPTGGALSCYYTVRECAAVRVGPCRETCCTIFIAARTPNASLSHGHAVRVASNGRRCTFKSVTFFVVFLPDCELTRVKLNPREILLKERVLPLFFPTLSEKN